MKNLLCLLVMTLFGVAVSAQRVHFVYFETDSLQPFYLKLDDKVYSSSSSGGFLLPNLPDSVYNVSIGFPSQNTEAKFKLAVNGKDYGYSIKSFEFGLGLYDLQSSSVTRPEADKWKNSITYQYRNNDFTSLLAKASNDTSLFYVPIVMKEDLVQKQGPVTEPKTTIESLPDTNSNRIDSAMVARPEAVNIKAVAVLPVIKPAEKQNSPYVFPGALSADSVSGKETGVKTGDTMVKSDPVNPIIVTPVLIDTVPHIEPKISDSTALVRADTLGVKKQDSVASQFEIKTDNKRSTVTRHSESSTTEGFGLVYFDINEDGTDTIRLLIPNPKISFKEADTTQFEAGLLEIKKDTQLVTTTVVPRANCNVTATDGDFFKLRRNMAAKESNEEMVSEAKKAFRTKCYSTGQVKNLSSLFLNDEGKYQFFDAAYTHVTDQEVFYALQSELKDEYYLKRFKALVGK